VFYPIEFKELTWLRLNSPTVSGSPKAHKHRKLRRVYYGHIKLALKATGRPITDEEAGPVTWNVWMRKK